MDELLSETVAQPRLQTGLLSLFAGVALVLAAVGLYGVLAYAVTQRTREIGDSHGARRAEAKRALARDRTGDETGAGRRGHRDRLRARADAGDESLLYGVKPTDPLTFAVGLAAALGVALLACWLPARRAARVDPMEALRCE